MPDETQKERHVPHVLTTLAGVLIAFLLLAAIYVVYQAAHILFPQNVYETALPAVISDTVEADGVLLFDESYVAGSGNLGYLAADGERVSAGTAVAEVYSNASQASLRLQLNQLNDQIDLLQKSQNTSALQLDTLLKERSSALYDLLDTLDDSDYEAVDDDANAYLLAQNKLWVVTGEAANLPIRSLRWSSSPRACRRSWAARRGSLHRRPAILCALPAADGSMPVPMISLH